MKKFAVILCGCGCMDGSEIHESVMTLLAIDRKGCTYDIFAPDDDQYHVVNHYTGQVIDERRNMLVEGARIARGAIRPLEQCNVDDYDAIVFPGGFGAAKSLFTYAFEGANCTVREDVATLVRAFHAKRKPIGALCIAPVMIAKVLGDVNITVGTNESTIADVCAFGATHTVTQHTEAVADSKNLVFTTPCYMLPARISDIADCADHLIQKIREHLQ